MGGIPLYRSKDTCLAPVVGLDPCAAHVQQDICLSENCFWTGATCYQKVIYDHCKAQFGKGNEDCSCVQLPDDVLRKEVAGFTGEVNADGFGATCDAWYNGRYEKCDNRTDGPGLHKGLCQERWCYVDP